MMKTAKQNMGLKALVAANRAAGRLSEPVAPDNSKKMQLAGMRLLPAELEQAKALADADERSLAWFCRRMYLRGLQSFLAENDEHKAGQ